MPLDFPSRTADAAPPKPRPPRRDPPASADFARTIRADGRINVTVRLCWLMASLAHKNGFCSMSVTRMAEELGATPEAVEKARRKLIRLGIFEPKPGWRWYRAGEKSDFTERCLAQKRLDLASRAVWLLTWFSQKEGSTKLSPGDFAKILNTSPAHIARAIQKALKFGYFAVGGDGRTHTYHRVAWEAPEEEVNYPSETGDDHVSNYSEFQRRSKLT